VKQLQLSKKFKSVFLPAGSTPIRPSLGANLSFLDNREKNNATPKKMKKKVLTNSVGGYNKYDFRR